jgi:hypothetical protein
MSGKCKINIKTEENEINKEEKRYPEKEKE